MDIPRWLLDPILWRPHQPFHPADGRIAVYNIEDQLRTVGRHEQPANAGYEVYDALHDAGDAAGVVQQLLGRFELLLPVIERDHYWPDIPVPLYRQR